LLSAFARGPLTRTGDLLWKNDCLTSFYRLCEVDLTITDSHLSRSKAAIPEAAGARLCIVDVAKANLDREAGGPKAEQTPSRVFA
jgi:hypothetical protein